MPESTTAVPGYPAKLLERFPPANGSIPRRFALAQLGRGCKPATLVNSTRCLLTFALALPGGVAIHTATGEQLTAGLAALHGTHKPRTVAVIAAWTRAYVRWAHQEAPPPALIKSLRVATRGTGRPARRPLSEAEFHALLTAAGERPDAKRGVMLQALIWLLWDTGFRISEALAVRVRDWQPDGEGVHVGPDPNAPRLKTGPRTIFVVDCVGAVKAWLAIHPARNDASAPLFDLTPADVAKALRRLASRAGTRHIHAHLFRHTRATRAARAQWTEHHMNQYFGWAPGSKEAATYVHLYRDDVADLVRRDAGVDPIGRAVRDDPAKALAQVSAASASAAVAELVRALGLGKHRRDDEEGTPAALLTT